MPGFNGTGPQGFGPRSGGGRGVCANRAYGTGYGRGAGRGRNRSGPRYAYAEPRGAEQDYTRDQEMQLLRNRADVLEQELEQIKRKLNTITKD